jgi:hypothetical protein
VADILKIGIQLRRVINSVYFNTRINAIPNVYANHNANGCSDDENDMENDSINIWDEYSLSEIINRCDYGQNHLIQARLSSNNSLIQHQETTNTENNVR